MKGNQYDQQQDSTSPENRNNPAIQLAESLKGIKEIENAKKGDKSVPEQMAPDKANSTILMLGAMALLIAGAMALPAGAVAIPFLGIIAGVAGAMAIKNMADMAKITPGKGSKGKIDDKFDQAKIKAIDIAILELQKKTYQDSPQLQDSPRSFLPDASTSQNPRESQYKPELASVLRVLADNIENQPRTQPAQNPEMLSRDAGENPVERHQISQGSRQGEISHRPTAWGGGGGALVPALLQRDAIRSRPPASNQSRGA